MEDYNMNKLFVLILTATTSATLCYAAVDFIQFGNPMGMGYPTNTYRNPIYSNMNSALNMMQNYNSYSNPYDTGIKNPITKVFKSINDRKYSQKPLKESDVEYLLSKMEQNRFGASSSDVDIENRLDRLETQVFGTIQSGDYKTRINRLKHAFSAEASRSYKTRNQKTNRFKEMFSSGYPTSIPADSNYYSSLDDDFSVW